MGNGSRPSPYFKEQISFHTSAEEWKTRAQVPSPSSRVGGALLHRGPMPLTHLAENARALHTGPSHKIFGGKHARTTEERVYEISWRNLMVEKKLVVRAFVDQTNVNSGEEVSSLQSINNSQNNDGFEDSPTTTYVA